MVRRNRRSRLRLPGCDIAPPCARRRSQAAHLHRDSAATRVSDGGGGLSVGGRRTSDSGDHGCAGGAAICLALVVGFLFYSKVANNKHTIPPAIVPQPQKSIAVLPFLDLTD